MTVTRAPSRKSRLARPSAAQLDAALKRLRRDLEQKQRRYFERVQSRQGMRHESHSVAEKEFAILGDIAEAFARSRDVRSDGLPALMLERMRSAEEELCRGMRPHTLRVQGDVEGPDADSWREYDQWCEIVRSLLTAVMVQAVDPRMYWNEIDGDAALVVADAQRRAAVVLDASPQFVHLWDALPRVRAGDPELAYLLETHLFVTREIPAAVGMWLDGWTRAKSVKELGKTYPFPFPPIPSDLFGGKSGAKTPYHMHARAAAVRRLRILEEYWDVARANITVRTNDGKTKTLAQLGWYALRINAGSLHRGGAHPPHKTHRDGTMFDAWLKNERSPENRNEGFLRPFVADSRERTVEIADEYEPGIEEELVGAPPRPIAARPLRATEVGDATDWVIAPGSRAQLELDVVWMFSKCLYLTYPGSVLLAPKWLTVGARNELIESAKRLGGVPARQGEPTRIPDPAIPRDLRPKFARIADVLSVTGHPTPWDSMPPAAAIAMRAAHANHWHINYNPDLLGPEGNVRADPRRGDLGAGQTIDDVADAIAEVLTMTNDEYLWLPLLGVRMSDEMMESE